MDDKAHDIGSFWIEEINGKVQNPIRKKRKYRTKKKEYDGWGSTSLIRFLQSIGIDTGNKLTQSEVTDIINEYVKQNNLVHCTKKKRIVCDERLHSLFGRKTIGRLKINDLLESHFEENCGKSDDDFFFNSDDDENAVGMCETPKSTNSERKSQSKKPVMEKPKSCFAAIIPFNIKLVYLKRSLVEELLKEPETFETKVVGGFVRIRCDPNDYLQKNSHQLLQVTGVKKGSGINGGILLQVSGFFKDVSIHMLSDDNFSEEECKDLHQRVKDDLLKRPTIVDIEQTARALHEDMTKHWLARELVLLQNLIDRANEKGWRRELFEYLQKREKLQSPVEQERLLHEIPQAIADDLESESPTLDVSDKRIENDLQESWQTTSKQASLVTEVPKAVADGFVWKATKLDIADDLESESPTLDVSDKRIENDLQVSWQTTSKQASLVTEVPKAVADGFVWKATKLDIADDLESESPTLDVSDKRIENDLQESWQTTSKQASLVTEVPKAVADGFVWKATKLDIADLVRQENNSPKSILGVSGASKVPLFNMEMNGTVLNSISRGTDAEHQWSGMPVQQQPEQQIDLAYKNNGMSNTAESNEVKISQGPKDKQVQPSQPEVIELSDDEEDEEPNTTKQVPTHQLESLMWYYRDPQGHVQGPFSLTNLKRWNDASYFPPYFKVWKAGQSQYEAVLLVNILDQFFPRSSNRK